MATPVLQVRDRLPVLPIIGMIDTQRAKQLTEGLLRGIMEIRARVVVMDITGVAAVDSKVANHLLQTVAAARLMGSSVIVTGLSADAAQALVGLGVDLGKMNTMADLQSGLEGAGGCSVIRSRASTRHKLSFGWREAIHGNFDSQAGRHVDRLSSGGSDQRSRRLRDDLAEKVGRLRSRGVVIDGSALDVMDSFASRTVRICRRAQAGLQSFSEHGAD